MPDWLTPEQRSRNMAAIRSKGTTPEERLGLLVKELMPRRKGVRHPPLPGKPDFYLPGLKLALFSDGCFWHGCPSHGRVPDDNRDYWEPKLARNKERDRAAVIELRALGIRALRLWEHDLRGDMKPARKKLRAKLSRLAS